jgi:hypothetical protein
MPNIRSASSREGGSGIASEASRRSSLRELPSPPAPPPSRPSAAFQEVPPGSAAPALWPGARRKGQESGPLRSFLPAARSSAPPPARAVTPRDQIQTRALELPERPVSNPGRARNEPSTRWRVTSRRGWAPQRLVPAQGQKQPPGDRRSFFLPENARCSPSGSSWLGHARQRVRSVRRACGYLTLPARNARRGQLRAPCASAISGIQIEHGPKMLTRQIGSEQWCRRPSERLTQLRGEWADAACALPSRGRIGFGRTRSHGFRPSSSFLRRRRPPPIRRPARPRTRGPPTLLRTGVASPPEHEPRQWKPPSGPEAQLAVKSSTRTSAGSSFPSTMRTAEGGTPDGSLSVIGLRPAPVTLAPAPDRSLVSVRGL